MASLADAVKLCLIIFIDGHCKESTYSTNGCMVHTSGQRLCWFIPGKIPHLAEQLWLLSLPIKSVIIQVTLQDPSGFSTSWMHSLEGSGTGIPPLHLDISMKAQTPAFLLSNSSYYFEDEGFSRNSHVGPSHHRSPYFNGKKANVEFWQLLNIWIASRALETATR